MGIAPHHLAWACCLVPILATHLAWGWNVQAGLIEACNPYLDGCTSISRAARTGNALFLFRPLMLPYCLLLAAFWWLTASWFGLRLGQRPRRATAAAVLGTIAAAFLALYVTFLGEEGDTARFLRRYGINVFFGFTVLAQMLVTSALAGTGIGTGTRRALTALCALMLALGLASIPLQHLVADRDALLNAIEWNYALLMVSVFALFAGTWRRQHYRLEPRSG